MKTKIRRSQLLVIGCFFGFFLFCLVWGLAQPDRPSSAAENRSLAQRPAMRRVVTDFGGFAKDFESYAADQFPDREQLIGVYTALELAQGKKFARKAYCLQGGWLLTKPTPTKPADLSALQQALAQAGALDRPLVWCVLPLKNEALYDLEPAYFSDETGETNKQALTAALAQVEGLTVIDAEAPLVTGTLADREQYFYKTDFHWNARGAFAAAQEIARQLAGAGTIAETSVPQAEDFLWSELGGERRYQGDLNVWFSNQFSMQEDIPRYVPKNAADLRYFLHPGDNESVPRETIVGSGLDKDPRHLQRHFYLQPRLLPRGKPRRAGGRVRAHPQGFLPERDDRLSFRHLPLRHSRRPAQLSGDAGPCKPSGRRRDRSGAVFLPSE